MHTYLNRTQFALLGTNVLIVVGFGLFYLQSANYEFLAYVGSIVVIAALLFGTLRHTRFPSYLLAGVTLWALLHMMGGSIQTADGVLYAWRIFPFFDGGGEFYILKMDQVIHAYLYGVIALMFLHLLRHVVGVRTHRWFIASVAVFAAAGFSIINEIIEFWAAMNVPGNGVGGYENTVLDLIFNFGGAIIAVLVYEALTRKRNA